MLLQLAGKKYQCHLPGSEEHLLIYQGRQLCNDKQAPSVLVNFNLLIQDVSKSSSLSAPENSELLFTLTLGSYCRRNKTLFQTRNTQQACIIAWIRTKLKF